MIKTEYRPAGSPTSTGKMCISTFGNQPPIMDACWTQGFLFINVLEKQRVYLSCAREIQDEYLVKEVFFVFPLKRIAGPDGGEEGGRRGGTPGLICLPIGSSGTTRKMKQKTYFIWIPQWWNTEAGEGDGGMNNKRLSQAFLLCLWKAVEHAKSVQSCLTLCDPYRL